MVEKPGLVNRGMWVQIPPPQPRHKIVDVLEDIKEAIATLEKSTGVSGYYIRVGEKLWLSLNEATRKSIESFIVVDVVPD